jgi:23S rRNA (cytosine1962-C5)-methyltransferase
MFDVTGWVRLAPGEDRRIRDGHLWIYRNEIAATSGSFADGDLVWVEDWRKRKLGLGYVNLRSLISVRLLARGAKAVFDRTTFLEYLKSAIARRSHLEFDARRLVNAEGDRLAGLIVDTYGDVVVCQMQTLFWDRRRDLVVEALGGELKPRAIVLKHDSPSRKAEGLDLYSQVVWGELTGPVTIREGAAELAVDVIGGQKTGFYIDQRDNRPMVLPFTGGKHVLDCCCYTGAWSVMCALGGAKHVVGLDASSSAIDLAGVNAERNRVDRVATFEVGDVFEKLQHLAAAREKYDLVILDPPSLAKTRRAAKGAERGYLHLNRLALGLARPGGIVVTCSCSHHVSADRFREILTRAAGMVRKSVQVLRTGTQPEDHPAVLGVPETSYLTCLLLRVA